MIFGSNIDFRKQFDLSCFVIWSDLFFEFSLQCTGLETESGFEIELATLIGALGLVYCFDCSCSFRNFGFLGCSSASVATSS